MPYQRLAVEPPTVAGYAKLKYIGQFYKYSATPQFLDQELMMQLFNEQLAQGRKLLNFYQESAQKNSTGSASSRAPISGLEQYGRYGWMFSVAQIVDENRVVLARRE